MGVWTRSFTRVDVAPTLSGTAGADMESGSAYLEAREGYFERTIPRAIEGHAVFYYFSCRCAAGPPSANYEQRLTDWVAKRFGNRYQAEPIDVGRCMIAIRFEAVASDGDLGASPTPLKGSTP